MIDVGRVRSGKSPIRAGAASAITLLWMPVRPGPRFAHHHDRRRPARRSPARCAPHVELPAAELETCRQLASQVTIYRDRYGVPHIDGASDAAAIFGFAYAQAEDYFWQIEDSYILSLGRYAEVHGVRGLNSDLLNRAFEIVPKTKAAYQAVGAELQSHVRSLRRRAELLSRRRIPKCGRG